MDSKRSFFQEEPAAEISAIKFALGRFWQSEHLMMPNAIDKM
jgi:hypothetical protein